MSGLVIDHVAEPAQFFSEMTKTLTLNGRAVVSAVHPDLQRLTGADIDVTTDQGAARIQGHIHEVADLVAAARLAQLTVEVIQEPPVTAAMVKRRPDWKSRLGCPALVLLALVKRGS
jgi:hypothetical protein